MKRTICIAFLILCAAAAFAAQGKARVEVAFALDSTGSMSGLIEGAKQKIWSIANSVVKRDADREVAIGLITYRDRGDEYVVKRFDLTEDIDAVFENLQSFRADGGGDGEESVNQALHEAVKYLSWSKDPEVLKIVFLVGDYPPHMDYAQDVRYKETCARARKLGIVINTVQCGNVPETTPVWREIAKLAKGEYIALEQSGNMSVIETPYDGEISRLSSELGSTMVAYGSEEAQVRSNEKLKKAAEAPASVAADRAAFNLSTGGKAIQGRGDLLADFEDGSVDLSKVKDGDLPANMRKMKPEERRKYLEGLKAARDKLNAKLAELSKNRAAYIEAENEKTAAANKGDSFDAKVSEIINDQADRLEKD